MPAAVVLEELVHLARSVEHRRQIVLRRSLFMLKQARARREIVEGLGLAIDQIDRIIAIIRAAKDPAEAKDHLMAEPLTGLADAIVDLVSTGSTLKANHLLEVERIMDISSRLVVNPAALKLKREPLRALIDAFEAAVGATA